MVERTWSIVTKDNIVKREDSEEKVEEMVMVEGREEQEETRNFLEEAADI
jgi:hypothetical protein